MRGDFRYLAGYLSEEEFEAIVDFVPYMIQETQFVIDMNQGFGIDMTWETVTRDGDSTINASGLFSDCNYVFWAFGAERGYQNTELLSCSRRQLPQAVLRYLMTVLLISV